MKFIFELIVFLFVIISVPICVLCLAQGHNKTAGIIFISDFIIVCIAAYKQK